MLLLSGVCAVAGEIVQHSRSSLPSLCFFYLETFDEYLAVFQDYRISLALKLQVNKWKVFAFVFPASWGWAAALETMCCGLLFPSLPLGSPSLHRVCVFKVVFLHTAVTFTSQVFVIQTDSQRWKNTRNRRKQPVETLINHKLSCRVCQRSKSSTCVHLRGQTSGRVCLQRPVFMSPGRLHAEIYVCVCVWVTECVSKSLQTDQHCLQDGWQDADLSAFHDSFGSLVSFHRPTADQWSWED